MKKKIFFAMGISMMLALCAINSNKSSLNAIIETNVDALVNYGDYYPGWEEHNVYRHDTRFKTEGYYGEITDPSWPDDFSICAQYGRVDKQSGEVSWCYTRVD